RARIVEHIDHLRRELPDVRASWTREENQHLTLKFLGDVPVADIPKLSLAVEAATHAASPFELAVSGCGAFPPHGQPKVLWIGVLSEPPASSPLRLGEVGVRARSLAGGRSGSLGMLHATLETECFRAGFPREQRPFHPHLTIARLRSSKGARRLAE